MRDQDSGRSQEGAAAGHSGFNRRDFLKGSGAAVAATAIATGGAEAQAKTKANVVPARAVDVKLKINGKNETLKLEPRTTLLDALRNWLSLTGCKEVCDTTNCGACTVQVDGKALYACSVLAIECEGKAIKTVESLRSGDKVDEVISGFVKHDAMQCGFCTPGFVVATRTILDKNPKATRKEIDAGLGGNICRCGTYDGIAACAMEISKGGA
jgi:xanthine dehydrogenase YagT iron-sulfur-binding subunit